MKQFDIKSEIESQQKHYGHTFLNDFSGEVARETAKVKIKHLLTCRDHVFGDGEKGKVADKLVIEIDFSEATIQPHSDFERDFCGHAVEAIQENVNGLIENHIMDDDSDEEDEG